MTWWPRKYLRRLVEILMRITLETFTLQLCQDLADQDVCNTFKTKKQHDKDAEKIEGEREVIEVEIVIDDNDYLGEMGAKHTVLNEEQAAFADWINDNLKNDKNVEHKLLLSVIPDNVFLINKLPNFSPRSQVVISMRRWMTGSSSARW